ncbi:MAG: NADH-quinone oxidoreductase subunit J [Desulfobulbaceae bacterium]|nr:NADH-quinone oxidoreductase subunit J [Desulfobulbaceae bacterium]
MQSEIFSAEGFVGLIFLITVGIVIFGAVIATMSRRLVRSVAGLAIAFTGVAGIYYFLLSPFVAMMQMLIYVGAVSILIAFAIMMADPEDHAGGSAGPILAGPLGFSIGALIFAAFTVLGLKTEWQEFPKQRGGDIEQLGIALLTTHTLVFEVISIVLLIAIIGALVLARKGRS